MSSNATQQLEASLKSTLHSLSLIVFFYSNLQALSAVPYASRAPRHLVQKLKDESKGFEEVCDAIENKILRAIAVIERDILKSQGLIPPISSTSAPDAQTNPITSELPEGEQAHIEGQTDSKPSSSIKGTGNEKLVTSTPDTENDRGANQTNMDLDSSFLHTSLFGDSAAPSPSEILVDDAKPPDATDTVSGITVPNSIKISDSPSDVNIISEAGCTSIAPTTEATSSVPLPGLDSSVAMPPDLASMLSMLNSSYASTSSILPVSMTSPTALSPPQVSNQAAVDDLLQVTSQPVDGQEMDVTAIMSNYDPDLSNTGGNVPGLGDLDFSTFGGESWTGLEGKTDTGIESDSNSFMLNGIDLHSLGSDIPTSQLNLSGNADLATGVGMGVIGGFGGNPEDTGFNTDVPADQIGSNLDSEMDFGSMGKLDLEELLNSFSGAAGSSSEPTS